MPAVHHRKLKLIELSIGDTQYECQLSSWTINNNTDDGERHYTFCPDGEFFEEADDEYELQLTFFADWRAPDGISHFATINDQQIVNFRIDHHPDIPAEHVVRTGQVKVKAPNMGGDARATEMTEVTWPIIGKPGYGRGDESPS